MSADNREAPRASNAPLNLLVATYMLLKQYREQKETTVDDILESISKILHINKKDNKIIIDYNKEEEFKINEILPKPIPRYISSWYIGNEYAVNCYFGLVITNISFNLLDNKIILTINRKQSYDYDIELEVSLHCKKKASENSYKCSIANAEMAPIPISNIILEVNNEVMLWFLILLFSSDNINISKINNCYLSDKKLYEAAILAKVYERYYECETMDEIFIKGFIALPKCIEDIINKANTLARSAASDINELTNLNVDDILSLLPNPQVDYVKEVINDAQLDTFKAILSKLL